MSDAIHKTIKILASSRDQKAGRVLRLAMKSSHKLIRVAASHEAVTQRHQQGLVELIRQFGQLDPEQISLLSANRRQFSVPIRALLLSDVPEYQENAMLAVEKLMPYELIPTLLHYLEQGALPGYVGVVHWAVNQLMNGFVREFDGTTPKKVSYGHILTETVNILQKAVGSWRRHQRELFLTVFLKLFPRMEQCTGELAEMATDPKHPAYQTFLRKILESPEPEVLQFVIHSLRRSSPPSSVLAATARRTDRLFLKVLFEATSYKSDTFKENLLKVRRFEWMNALVPLLLDFDAGYHRFLVDLIHHSGIHDDEKYRVYDLIVKHGKTEGRLAVTEALTGIRTANADRLMLELSDDPEPTVQSAALARLRQRGIRTATVKLMQYIDSPHPVVRRAIFQELPEFRMRRFIEHYPKMTPDQRRQTLDVVRKLDPEMKSEILHEMRTDDPSRQDQALEIIALAKMVTEMEEELIQFTWKSSHEHLKSKALKLLAVGTQKASLEHLKNLAENGSRAETRLLAQRLLKIRLAMKAG